MRILARADTRLQNLLGLGYLRYTREVSIHQRSRYFAAQLRALGGGRVLDAGCGAGITLRYLSPAVATHYTGFDLDTDRLHRRNQSVPIPHQFLNINLDGDWNVDTVDVAWCSEVLEHLTDDQRALRRIVASVRPGGHVVITMPSLAFTLRHKEHVPTMRDLSAEQDGGHVRYGYDRSGVEALASAAGLVVERIDAISPFTDRQIERYYGPVPLRLTQSALLPVGRRAWVEGATDADLLELMSIAAILRRPA